MTTDEEIMSSLSRKMVNACYGHRVFCDCFVYECMKLARSNERATFALKCARTWSSKEMEEKEKEIQKLKEENKELDKANISKYPQFIKLCQENKKLRDFLVKLKEDVDGEIKIAKPYADENNSIAVSVSIIMYGLSNRIKKALVETEGEK